MGSLWQDCVHVSCARSGHCEGSEVRGPKKGDGGHLDRATFQPHGIARRLSPCSQAELVEFTAWSSCSIR